MIGPSVLIDAEMSAAETPSGDASRLARYMPAEGQEIAKKAIALLSEITKNDTQRGPALMSVAAFCVNALVGFDGPMDARTQALALASIVHNWRLANLAPAKKRRSQRL